MRRNDLISDFAKDNVHADIDGEFLKVIACSSTVIPDRLCYLLFEDFFLTYCIFSVFSILIEVERI